MGYEENDPVCAAGDPGKCWMSSSAKFENIRIKTLLSGEYDNNNAIVTLHAGAGGTEVLRLVRHAVPYVHPLGGDAKAFPWKFWTIWTAMRRA